MSESTEAELRRLTDPLVKGTTDLALKLATIEGKIDALLSLFTSPRPAHSAEPEPDASMYPIFDGPGREIGVAAHYSLTHEGAPEPASLDYPLTATCTCRRLITRISFGSPWEHCG